MNTKFPHVLAAVEKGEKAYARFQWEVGDALISDVGVPTSLGRNNGNLAKLEACSKELATRGFEYTSTTLRSLWVFAYQFPAKRRHYELSFGVHQDARDPDTLDAIIKGAPKGQAIVQSYVRGVMTARSLAHQRELDAETKRREHNAEIARRERQEAQETARKATSISERKAAEERAASALKRENENRVAPKKKDIPRPSVENTPILVAKLRFDSELSDVKLKLKRMQEGIIPLVEAGELTQIDINAGVEELLEIAEAARKLADLLRSKQTNKRGHIAAVA